MKCKRCHREIKNPKSVQNGYGPVCWSKMLAAHPVAVGKTSTEKSFVPIFIKQIKKNRTKDKEPDKPQSGDKTMKCKEYGRKKPCPQADYRKNECKRCLTEEINNETQDIEESGDENKATTWTDMYGIIHVLESGN